MSTVPSAVSMAEPPCAPPGRQHHDLVAAAHAAGGDPAGVAPVVRVLLGRRGRITYWTGKRSSAGRSRYRPDRRAPDARACSARCTSRCARTWSRRCRRAARRSGSPSPRRCRDRGRRRSNSAAIRSKTLSSKSTRSILLTASTRCGTPSRAATAACRRVCATTPVRASTRMITRSAVDAPVTVLRVYCTCPGVSARMKRAHGGGEVAVGDVDGDALLALGPQAVDQQRQVRACPGRGPARSARRRPAGRTAPISSRAAADRPGSTCRRRREPAVAKRNRPCRGVRRRAESLMLASMSVSASAHHTGGCRLIRSTPRACGLPWRPR